MTDVIPSNQAGHSGVASRPIISAEEQGKFWQLRERLFANQKTLEPWSAHAEALGLNVAQFEACLDSGEYTEAVRQDMAEATKAGATGTPSFVVALVDDKDPQKVSGFEFIRGANLYAVFKRILDEAFSVVAKEK